MLLRMRVIHTAKIVSLRTIVNDSIEVQVEVVYDRVKIRSLNGRVCSGSDGPASRRQTSTKSPSTESCISLRALGTRMVFATKKELLGERNAPNSGILFSSMIWDVRGYRSLRFV
jgi:hypothetical protein